jgi:hypothetical protein
MALSRFLLILGTRTDPQSTSMQFRCVSHRTTALGGCLAIATACTSARLTPTPESATIPTFRVESAIHDSAGHSLSALVGTVEDSASGQSVAAALVLLASRDGTRHYYVYSDRSGGFVVERVQPGSYNLSIRKVAYHPYEVLRDLRADAVDTLRVRLRAFPHEF